jgi:hypothetical protein
MLKLFLDKLPEEKMDVLVDSELGSVLHYFAAVDYAQGIRKLTSTPYEHPPELENCEGVTPLLVAIKSHSFVAMLQLLDLQCFVGSYNFDKNTIHFWSHSEDETVICDIIEVLRRVSMKYADKGKPMSSWKQLF